VVGKNKSATVHREESIRLLVYALALTIGIAVLCSRLFGLQRPYALALAIGSILAAPFLKRAVQAEKREYQRFCDVNSYMQQFISGMILHRRITAALEEVYITFPDGEMHENIKRMLLTIRRSADLEKAEKEAFAYMYQCYPNSQLPLIHDFALRVEKRGGEFETEMNLLSQKREKWEKRTEHCQAEMKVTLYSSVLLYATMIFVCAMVQRMMPEELSVLEAPLSQTSEVLLVLCFYFFIGMVMRNMAGGWIRKDVLMDEDRAEKIRLYLEQWKPSARRKNRLRHVMLLHRLRYRILLHRVKKELASAVPRWLFDVCLLMQKYNITVSITESLKTAPAILKEDIRRLLDKLKRNPSGVEAYLSFLEEYRLQNVKSTMRMLVAIQNGAAGDSLMQMEQLIAHNMNMLDELDAKETELRDALNIRYNIYPMIPGAIVMGGYLVSMVIRIFGTMTALL
jgi:hypothetical protein